MALAIGDVRESGDLAELLANDLVNVLAELEAAGIWKRGGQDAVSHACASAAAGLKTHCPDLVEGRGW